MQHETLADVAADPERWLLERFLGSGRLMAEADGDLDASLSTCADAGLLTQCDCHFGNNYYALTDQGRRTILDRFGAMQAMSDGT